MLKSHMRQKYYPILPKYAYIPLGTSVVFNQVVYSGSKFLTANLPHHNMALELDAMIPFCPTFISIYILAYLQWCIGYIVIARDSRELCYNVIVADMVSECICLVFFIACPTIMYRPKISGTGIWNTLTSIIYSFDSPVNLFPSIHCLKSWFCFRGAMLSSKPARWYRIVTLIFSLLVFASTVLVKQHVVLDIIGGILTAEAGLFLSRKLRLRRIFVRLEPSFVKQSLQDLQSNCQ